MTESMTMDRPRTTPEDPAAVAAARRSLFRELRSTVDGFSYVSQKVDEHGQPFFEVGVVDPSAWTAPTDHLGFRVVVVAATPARVPVGEAPAA